jgi:hypothetical protein
MLSEMFGHISPAHKKRVIRIRRGYWHVVGFIARGFAPLPLLAAKYASARTIGADAPMLALQDAAVAAPGPRRL